MLFPPGERLPQELSGLVQVEISGSQETQHMLILWNLQTPGRNILQKSLSLSAANPFTNRPASEIPIPFFCSKIIH